MAKRKKLSKKGSKKLFSKTARAVHKKNAPRLVKGAGIMRGGIRL